MTLSCHGRVTIESEHRGMSGRLHACANSIYQAFLSPPAGRPGYEATVLYACLCSMFSMCVHVIVVSWFLQCMGFVQPLRGTNPMHCKKNMRQLTCTDRLYKITARLTLAPECLFYTYCTPSVWHKVPYARCCSYSSIV